MATEKVVVRRSPWKVMAIGLVGVPFVLLVVDYVWGVAGLFDRIIEWSYGPKDPEAWEPRDDILAALMAVTGGLMVLFAIKELVAPRRLLFATTDGLRLPLSGPFGRSTSIGWLQVEDIETDDGAVQLQLAHAGGVPEDPWGARWTDDRTLRVPTWWWDRPADDVLDEIAAKGLPDEAQRRRREIAMEEARAHAAAMELISGAAVVADPTEDVPSIGDGRSTIEEASGVGRQASDEASGVGRQASEEAGEPADLDTDGQESDARRPAPDAQDTDAQRPTPDAQDTIDDRPSTNDDPHA